MIDLVIYNKNIEEILLIVRDLKTQKVEFEWAYFRGVSDFFNDYHVPKRCKFTFKNDKDATFFVLKYGDTT